MLSRKLLGPRTRPVAQTRRKHANMDTTTRGQKRPTLNCKFANFRWEGSTPKVWCQHVGWGVSGQSRNTGRGKPWVHILPLLTQDRFVHVSSLL